MTEESVKVGLFFVNDKSNNQSNLVLLFITLKEREEVIKLSIFFHL